MLLLHGTWHVVGQYGSPEGCGVMGGSGSEVSSPEEHPQVTGHMRLIGLTCIGRTPHISYWLSSRMYFASQPLEFSALTKVSGRVRHTYLLI